MKNEKKTTIIIPLLISFLLMSLYHVYEFNQTISALRAFSYRFKDLLLIGLILFIVSILVATPLVIWSIFSLKKWGSTTKNIIHLNGVSILYATISTVIAIEFTANFYEAFQYINSYFFIFLILLNTYIFLGRSFSFRR